MRQTTIVWVVDAVGGREYVDRIRGSFLLKGETMNPKDKDMLESLMDAYSCIEFMSAMSDICREKAEHIRTNWQDHRLAKVWEANARRLEHATQ